MSEEEIIDLAELMEIEGEEADDELATLPAVYDKWMDESLPLIIRFAVTEYRKSKRGAENEEYLNEEQVRYIDLLSKGMASNDACAAIGIDPIIPTIWLKVRGNGSVYGICVQAIKDNQADALEDVMWQEAIENPRNTDIKKYVLKARKPEYRDGVLPQTNIQTNIRVTFDGVPYSVNATVEEADA